MRISGKTGHPLRLGRFVLAGAPFSPDISVRLRVGPVGEIHVVEYDSAAPPTAPALLTLDRTLGEVVAQLDITATDALGAGQFGWQLDVVSATLGVLPLDDSRAGIVAISPEIG